MSNYSPDLIRKLEDKAREMRKDIIVMVGEAQSGHPGGSLSAADILAALYFKVMRYDANNPKWEDRDRFILSKGHASPVLYAALAEAGFFPKDDITTFRKINSSLQGHPDMKKLAGVDFTTGSLGQGISAANGMAIAGKLDKKDYHVYCLIGDGESEEGQIWEAGMASAHYKLDNLTVITDYNGLQIDGPNCEVMTVAPLADKWKSFGWNVIEIDGHNFEEILDALSPEKIIPGMPTMIIAHTIKGKCVSFMEGVCDWHGKAPSADQVREALAEL
jgi:transketolase